MLTIDFFVVAIIPSLQATYAFFICEKSENGVVRRKVYYVTGLLYCLW